MLNENTRRLLQIENTLNLRELGGYPTNEGSHTRWRRLLRSDNLNCVSTAAFQTLRGYGLGLIIDLRSTWEVENFPYQQSQVVRNIYRHVPLFEMDKGNRLEHFKDYIEYYQIILEDFQPRLKAIFDAIAARDLDRLVLFHCASGKDRTGLIAAMVLELAGVAPYLIAQDYALSAGYLEPRISIWRQEAVTQGKEMARFELEVASDPQTMLDTLNHLQKMYGGIENYLVRFCKLEARKVAQLKASLVE